MSESKVLNKSLNEDETSGEENSILANNESIPENKKKKGPARHRKRDMLNKIREQMEFYFSDANLMKDRFLMQLIKSDPYVPLDIFLKFNKIKKIAKTVDEIAKSLENSKILQLDEDKTKICRSVKLPEIQDPAVQEKIDKCTLYVEGIPPQANHDWLKKVFTQFSGGGAVQYVSLPKYKRTKKIKEFAFIEFENEESVLKCLKKFQDFGGVLCEDKSDPSKLTSVTSFLKEQQEEETAKKNELSVNDEKTSNELKSSNEGATEDSITSSLSSSEDDELDPPKIKKAKLSENVNEEAYYTSKSHLSTAAETEEEKLDANGNLKKKKLRKRTKKQKTKSKKLQLGSTVIEQPNGTTKTLNMDTDVRELKVLPKKDWKRLRNKYLNLQREKISELKRKAWELKQQQSSGDKKEAFKKLIKNSTSPTKIRDMKSKPIEFNKESPMNFYCSVNDEIPEKRKRLTSKSETDKIEEKKNPPTFQYQAGIILKIDLHEPCVDVKGFKSDMKQYDTVKYVDVKEGSNQAHLRIDTPENCNELGKKLQCTEMKCSVLSGNEETQYWEKITQDREQKLNKKIAKDDNNQIRPRRKRGRDKVNKIIASHVRFNDEDF